MNTEAINHDPAITFIQTGIQQPGRPSMGSWVSYGLGSENENLPAFVVLISQASGAQRRPAAVLAPVGQRLPAVEVPGREVPLRRRPGALPVRTRRASTPTPAAACSTRVAELNEIDRDEFGDPEIADAHRAVRDGVPDADLGARTDGPLEGAGAHLRPVRPRCRASPARSPRNCLLARRLAERGVRFIQLYHRGWDQHGDLPRRSARCSAKDTDQASAALVKDLKQRGLLDDTLVIWGGEFGRTVYCQGKLTETNYGRDHHPRCFTMWLAGGGIKPGMTLRRDRRLLLQHRRKTRSTSTT